MKTLCMLLLLKEFFKWKTLGRYGCNKFSFSYNFPCNIFHLLLAWSDSDVWYFVRMACGSPRLITKLQAQIHFETLRKILSTKLTPTI